MAGNTVWTYILGEKKGCQLVGITEEKTLQYIHTAPQAALLLVSYSPADLVVLEGIRRACGFSYKPNGNI